MNRLEPAFELSGQIEMIATDGAGSLFDKGSEDPVIAFQQAFHTVGIEIEVDTIKEDIGGPKKPHIVIMLQKEAIRERVLSLYGSDGPQESDVETLYGLFNDKLLPLLANTSEIEGVKDAAFRLKENGTPLVMTTGYNDEMVDIIRKRLKWLDEVVGHFVTSSDGPGRPDPFMLQNAREFVGVTDPTLAVKGGDAKLDLEAPNNDGMPSIMLLSGSVPDVGKAEAIIEEIGRRHLILPSLENVIDFAIDGTLREEIRALNI